MSLPQRKMRGELMWIMSCKISAIHVLLFRIGISLLVEDDMLNIQSRQKPCAKGQVHSKLMD
eukprot:1141471-Pelagomonas_calceolata.AAC.3